MIAKYQEELAKFGLRYVITSELIDRYRGYIVEDGALILNKWIFYKEIAPSRIPNFAALTKVNVDNHKRIMKLLGENRVWDLHIKGLIMRLQNYMNH